MADEKVIHEVKFPDKAKRLITAPIPSELIKQRPGGGNTNLSYISGSTVTDFLNAAFGYLWDWTVVEQWIQDGEPYWNKYKKPEAGWEETGKICHVHGILTAYVPDGNGGLFPIKKSGYGSKSVMGKQADQEHLFKAAGTDALKKAASLFGVGLELYRDEDEQSFFNAMNYEDPWTDEALAEFAGEREFITETMKTYELTPETMAPYVEEFSEGSALSLDDIVPDNIKAFVDFLRTKIAAASEEAAE